METHEIYDYLLDTNIAEEQTLEVVTSINGYNKQTLNDVIYTLTGYRDIKQFLEYEDTETYNLFYGNNE